MSIRTFFQSRASTSAGRRPATRRLGVEALDDRIVPASLWVSDATITEGNSGIQYAAAVVRLDAPSSKTVTVNYATTAGTATAGSDYQSVSGKLTFARGETSKTILVPVTGNWTPEPDETFSVHLSGAQGAKIADGAGVVTIVDDESRLSIYGAWAYEWGGYMTFTVTLSAATEQAVTVNFATRDGTTVASEDYQATAGTLTFAPGETTKTITVAVHTDSILEPTETFYITLSGASANSLIVGTEGPGEIYDQPDPIYGDLYGGW